MHELERDCQEALKLSERISEQFLVREAEILDDQRFSDWLDMLDPDIIYQAPVRTIRENWDQSGISHSAFYFDENMGSLRTRVEKLKSRFAWAENPATRTRRFVSNIRAISAEGGLLSVRSNIAIFCYRGDIAAPEIMTANRMDYLRLCDDGVRIVRRHAVLDATVLGIGALSIFI